MGKKKSKFAGKTNRNAATQKSKGSAYGHLRLPQGIRVFKEAPDSRVKLDFLPYIVSDPKHPDRDDEYEIAIPGEQWYKRPYKLHRNIGSNNDAEICPTSFGKKCPICEYRAKLLQDGADWKDDAVRALKASDRNLYVVIPFDVKDYEEHPHIWDISQFCFQEMLNEELGEDEAYGEFPDLENGLTLKIRFSEEALGKNTFAKAARIDFEKRDKAYDESILKKVPDLDAVLSCLSYAQLEAKFFEMDGETPPATEVADEPKKESGIQRRSKRTARAEKEEPAFEEELPENACVACEGTGTNSKGRKCPICDGTGINPKIEPEEEPAVEQAVRTKKEDASSRKSATKKSSGCPYEHEFGTDCEEFEDCDTCDEFEKCLDARE